MQLSEAPTFVIDPIDGTTNFVHGFPYVATSLALVIGRVSMVGVIYNPFLDTLYSAIRGEGAFETKRGTQRKLPLTASPQPLTKLNKCIVTAEWGYGRTGVNFEARKHVFGALAADKEDGGATVHALRSIGSSALNLCAVAAGQQDVWWEGGPWVSLRIHSPQNLLLLIRLFAHTYSAGVPRLGMWLLDIASSARRGARLLAVILESGTHRSMRACISQFDRLHQARMISLRNFGV